MMKQTCTMFPIHSLVGYLYLLASICTSQQGVLAVSPRTDFESDSAALQFGPAFKTLSAADTLPGVTLRNTESVSDADVAFVALPTTTLNPNREAWRFDRRTEREFRDPVSCVNTVQGKYLVSDNRGFVCSRSEIDTSTRCCPSIGSPFQCDKCNQTAQCCSVYEFCVSCCLHPDITTPETALAVLKGKQQSSAKFASVFEYCKGRCRHNSRSVVHENAYISENHHCFAPLPPVHDTGTGGTQSDEGSLEGVVVSVGMVGQSCDSVCANAAREGVPRQVRLGADHP